MAKSYAELEAAIQATAEQLSTLSPERKAIIDKIVALSKEDPCVEGFAAKLDEVDAAAEKVNAQSAALIAAINKNIDDVDEAESGFFGISVAQFNTLIRQQNVTSAGSRALNEMSTKADAKTKRTAMRTALNACSTTKPAEEEPETNDDPGANEDPDAEDDVGSNQDQDDKGDSSSGTGTTDNTVEDQSSVTPAGTTTAGKAGTASSKKNTKPNKRQQNPLGNLSSYTYNITLYMITPDAYNAFIASNRKDIDALKNSALATGAAAGAAAAGAAAAAPGDLPLFPTGETEASAIVAAATDSCRFRLKINQRLRNENSLIAWLIGNFSPFFLAISQLTSNVAVEFTIPTSFNSSALSNSQPISRILSSSKRKGTRYSR
jgi:hypothetical protein